MLVVDNEGHVQKINRTALQILSLDHPPSSLLKYYELIPSLKGVTHAWGQLTERQRLRYTFSLSDDREPHLLLQVVTLPEVEGKRSQTILVIQDVSKTLDLERKLAFETKLAATGELAAGIAHEIRNPLASISGSIELLGKHLDGVSGEDKKLLEISLRETKRLNTLITDFLEFAKPKNDTPEIFALSDLVEEVKEALKNSKKEKGLLVRNHVAPDLHAEANRERIKQVFFNLFINAVEASTSPGVEITVNASFDLAGYLFVDVCDNGPGIAPAVAKKIFDPFFTTKSDGTGLGLPTVAQVLEAAKGKIELVNASQGAHFRLTLPAASGSRRAGNAS
jgi:two-component system sensor histidine kinase PilS (NtrC family)